MEGSQIDCSSSENQLFDKWVLWAHLPHNTDWFYGVIQIYVKLIQWKR